MLEIGPNLKELILAVVGIVAFAAVMITAFKRL